MTVRPLEPTAFLSAAVICIIRTRVDLRVSAVIITLREIQTLQNKTKFNTF